MRVEFDEPGELLVDAMADVEHACPAGTVEFRERRAPGVEIALAGAGADDRQPVGGVAAVPVVVTQRQRSVDPLQ